MVWTDDEERLLRVRAHKYSLPVEALRTMLDGGCIYPGAVSYTHLTLPTID
jgi:hypothetical protein